MPEAHWTARLQPNSRQQPVVSPAPMIGQQEAPGRLSVADVFGETRQGIVLRIARWDESAASQLKDAEGDFRVVILDEPPPGPIQAPPGDRDLCPRPATGATARSTGSGHCL